MLGEKGDQRVAPAARAQRQPASRHGRGRREESKRLRERATHRRSQCASKPSRRSVCGAGRRRWTASTASTMGQAKPRDAAEAQAAVLRLMQSASVEDAPAMKIALAEAAGRPGRAGCRAGPDDTAAERHVVQRACRGPQGAPGAQGAEHGRGHEDRRRRRRPERPARRARHPAVAAIRATRQKSRASPR